jgi:ribosomal protein L24E
MRCVQFGVAGVLLLGMAGFGTGTDEPAKRSPREALQALNDLIGPWRATGIPEGTNQDKQRGFWTETHEWQWQFKGDDACIKFAIDKGKYYSAGELRYLPEKDLFQLTLTTPEKESLVFEGPFKDSRLTLERSDDKKKETQRLVIRLLHANRFTYRYEVKAEGRADFTRLYEVGVTKEGVAFAGKGDNSPECVVSGGLGTMAVSYKGKTYYVCCTGCRDAFKDNPEKYLKEYEERKAKEKGK